MSRFLTIALTSITSIATYKFIENRILSGDELYLPDPSSKDECKASLIHRNVNVNYAKMCGYADDIGGTPITLTNEDREAIANDCIDFIFTPVTKIIKQGKLDDGRLYANERQILEDGLVIVDYDNHLVHVNNLTMDQLGIADCVNDCKQNYKSPSDIKTHCLPKINHTR